MSKYFKYIGNGAYCYSNSTAMLLASIDENVSPALIEVVGGVGIGAYALPNSNISFLSGYSGLPDKAISRALKVLGFGFREVAKDNQENPPINEIREVLKSSPAIFGPLDMGYLTYDPDNDHHHGVDHFVLVYEINDNEIFLHDPAGFPNVSISLDKLLLAWKADAIQYKEGYYRYWTLPKRISSPSTDDIYSNTIKNLIEIYLTGEKYAKIKNRVIDYDAIMLMANNIKKGALNPNEIGMLTGFIFPLGARRASDFSDFLQTKNGKLAELKTIQSKLLGQCHSLVVYGKLKETSKLLEEYAEIEKEFKGIILADN